MIIFCWIFGHQGDYWEALSIGDKEWVKRQCKWCKKWRTEVEFGLETLKGNYQ